MEYLLKNARVFMDGALHLADVFIRDGRIISISQGLEAPASAVSIDLHNAAVFPGFVDVHVHLREPGFSYKETIRTGTLAAARGGFAHVCPMPNLNPVPDSREHLEEQLEIIRRDAVVHVHPYGAITRGEKGETLADLEAMAPDTAGFSDDGRGVQSPELMRSAMAEGLQGHMQNYSIVQFRWTRDRRMLGGVCYIHLTKEACRCIVAQVFHTVKRALPRQEPGKGLDFYRSSRK